MDDQRLENIIGQLLRGGVLLAAATVLTGGVLFIARHHAEAVHDRTFVLSAPETRAVTGIARSALHGDSAAIIQMGLVLLVLTPVARVVIAMLGFLLERDRFYAVVSLTVLVILTYSLMHAT